MGLEIAHMTQYFAFGNPSLGTPMLDNLWCLVLQFFDVLRSQQAFLLVFLLKNTSQGPECATRCSGIMEQWSEQSAQKYHHPLILSARCERRKAPMLPICRPVAHLPQKKFLGGFWSSVGCCLLFWETMLCRGETTDSGTSSWAQSLNLLLASKLLNLPVPVSFSVKWW
jgi:hypothetical protein